MHCFILALLIGPSPKHPITNQNAPLLLVSHEQYHLLYIITLYLNTISPVMSLTNDSVAKVASAAQSTATKPTASSSNPLNIFLDMYNSNDPNQRALAIVLPLLGCLALLFLGLIIFLLVRKRQLKAKLNETPTESPAISTSSSTTPASPDLIARPTSA